MVYRPLRYEQMMRAAEAHDVKARRMFGGMGVYTGEKMFAFLVGEEVGFKLAPDDLAQASRALGESRFVQLREATLSGFDERTFKADLAIQPADAGGLLIEVHALTMQALAASPLSATLPPNWARVGDSASAPAVRSSSQDETTLPRRQSSAMSVRSRSKRCSSGKSAEFLPRSTSKPSA